MHDPQVLTVAAALALVVRLETVLATELVLETEEVEDATLELLFAPLTKPSLVSLISQSVSVELEQIWAGMLPAKDGLEVSCRENMDDGRDEGRDEKLLFVMYLIICQLESL